MNIILSKSAYIAMLAQARAELPNECCGLLGGIRHESGLAVQKIYPLTNIEHSPEHFAMHSREQLAAVKQMRAEDLAPLGNYHSHPATPARPSQEDIRLAYDPNAVYCILSLAEDLPVLKAFSILAGKVIPVELQLHE